MIAFIVTLATLYLGRGFALWLTETRAMNLPDSFLRLGTARLLGVPLPVVALLAVVAGRRAPRPDPHAVRPAGLRRRPGSRGARKAGIAPARILAAVYVISGFCAALGGILALAQLGAVSPTFGTQQGIRRHRRGRAGRHQPVWRTRQRFPGTVLGAVLIQSVENGLVILNADPYLYPLITSGIIFLAVLTDSLRSGCWRGSAAAHPAEDALA